MIIPENAGQLSDYLKSAMDNSMDGIALLDANGCYFYLNHEHVVMFGYEKADELIGKSWTSIYSEEEVNRINNDIFPILIKEKNWRGETTGKSKKGAAVPQEISLSMLDDNSIICICRNIKKKKLDAKWMLLYQEILEKTNSMIIVTDQKGKIEWVNNAFCTLTGYNLSEIEGKTPGKVLQGKLSDQTEIAKIRTAIQQKKSFYSELINYKKDGTPYWIEIKGQPLFNEQGEVEHFFAIEEDITARKENEKKIEENNIRLELALKGIAAATWELNLSTGEIFYSDFLYEMTGYSEGEIKHFFGENRFLMQEGDRETTFSDFTLFLKSNKPSFEGEYRIRHKKGHYIWILMRAVVSERNARKEPEKIIGIIIDISNTKESQKKLEESVKTKRRFLANVSHEIRTPMHAIMGLSEQLALSELKPEQAILIKMIAESSKALMSIINDVLDLSKIEEGKLLIDEVVFDPFRLMQQIFELFSTQAAKRQIDFLLHQNKNEERVFISDPTRIRQILTNVISNAIKFTDTGKIDLFFDVEKKSDEDVILSFKCIDTGVGMSEEMKKRIFEEFVQEDESFHRKYGGSGLGLSITNELVKLMKGDIQIDSQKNKGTTVSIHIPLKLVRTANDFTNEDEKPVDFKKLEGLKLLVAEDNEFNRLLLKFILDKNHISYDFAENGTIAVEKALAEDYDMILMDIQMPEMDGIEATQILRKKIGTKIPIIAVTANAVKEELDYYLKNGLSDYLTKPFEEKKFLKKILDFAAK